MKPKSTLRSVLAMGSSPLLKHLALALMLGAGSAQAQFIIEVGGAATIADQALTTSKVPTTIGANWTVVGNNGGVYSGLVSPNVVVANTGAVTLTFTHRYNFEATYDGGALFVSVNGGAFTYVPLASFAVTDPVTGYNTTGLADPLSGTAWVNTNVFGGKSVGYDTPTLITSVADLGILNAADTVAVEFRGGWDGAQLNGPVAWEIATVNISDTGGALLNKNFIADGGSGFTVANMGAMTAPWAYPKATNRFEINATTLAADRYQPNIVGSAIDLDGANIEVVRVPGTTFVPGSTFTLFDLSGGTTLTGAFGNITLPGGTWDTSNLAVNGTITLVATAPPGIYEPFDYAGTVLANASGTTEYGFNAAWSSTTETTLGAGREFGPVVTRGAGIANLAGGVNRFGGARSVPPESLAQYNLLNDGAELWFSFIAGSDAGANVTNSRLAVALGAGSFGTGNGDFWINGGTGVGVNLSAGKPSAATFPANTGGATSGTSTATSYAAGTSGLIVGKITWNANPLLPDTIEIYQPSTALVLGSPVSTTTAVLDQTTYDTLTFRRGDKIVLDEIRFGASYAAVTETGSHWDLNSTTAGSGGPTPTDTWDAGSKWNAVPDGTGVTAAWDAYDVAVFAAGADATGAYDVIVAGTQDIGGVLFKEGTVTLTGGTALRATTKTNVSVAAGLTATIATPFTEDVAGRQLAKIGDGTLVLSGNNIGLTGGMRVIDGLLQFDTSSAIPGTLRNVAINSTGLVAFGSGVSSGDIATALADRITADSPGVIAANNQAATNFDFNTPGLTAASLGAVGPVSYTGTLTPNGATYRLGGGGGTLTMANANAITGANSLVVNPTGLANPGTVVLGAANDYTGTTTVNSFSTLRIMAATATSGITVNSSFLEFGDNNALGAGTLTLNASTITGLGSRVMTNPVQADGSFTITGIDSLTLGTMTLNNNVTITNNNTSATTTYTAITAIGGARTLAFSGNANSVVTGGIGGGTDVSSVAKNGTGTLTLSGANTFTGIATAAGGVLLLNHANALPGGIGDTGGTTGLTINGGMIGLAAGNFSRPLAAAGTAGSVTMTGNGGWAAYGADRLVNLGGASASVEWNTANTGLNARTLILSHATATHKVTLQNPFDLQTGTRTVQVDNGAAAIDAELSGALSSATGALTKTGTGTLLLSGNNTYDGLTTHSTAGSTLILAGDNSGAAGGLTMNNATAVLNINSNTALGTGTTTLTAGIFDNTSGSPKTTTGTTAIVLNGTTTYSGTNNLTLGGPVQLNNNRTITLNGASTLTLANLVNTFAGNPSLTVTAGTGNNLVIGDLALSAPAETVNRTVTITGTGNVTINGPVTAGGNGTVTASLLTKTGTGTLTLNGNNTYDGLTTHSTAASTLTLAGDNSGAAGGITMNNATAVLNVNHAGALGSGTFTLTTGIINNSSGSAKILTTNNPVTIGGAFTFSGSNDLTFGTGAITNAGSRTITLNGTGSTLAFGGVMTNTSNAIQTTTVNGPGNTLKLGGYALSSNTTPRINVITGTGNVTINGALSGSSAVGSETILSGLTYSGTGTLTLNGGTNIYTGATLVNSTGCLALVGGSQNSAITVNSGGFLGFTLGSPTTSTKAVTLSAGHKVRITGTPTPGVSYTLLTTSSTIGGVAPVIETPIGTHALEVQGGGTTLVLKSLSTPFQDWAALKGLDGTAGKENGKTDDPDGDGKNNNFEFAFNGNPLSGSDNGMIAGLVQDASLPAGNELTLVVAVRNGATFANAGSPVVQTATKDDVIYTIQGTLDLVTIPGSDVSHVGGPSNTAPSGSGLTVDLISADWKYHTFKLNASEGLGSKGFLRAKAE